MFTGIVKSVGRVKSIEGNVFTVSHDFEVLELGESIAVNGACMTVLSFDGGFFSFEVSEESFKKTNLGALRLGDFVNLEQSLEFGAKVSGHLVTGHVDFVGKVQRSWDGEMMSFSFDREYRKFIASKGSVSVNGISLTVVDVFESDFTVAVLPFTYENTNLRFLNEGASVNLEVDMIARYLNNIYENR